MQPAAASYFDGLTATRHVVIVSPSRDLRGVWLQGPSLGTQGVIWPLDRLRLLPGQAGAMTLTMVADTDDEAPRDPARLVISDPGMMDFVRATAPGLAKVDTRRGTYGRLALRLTGAIAAIGLILFVLLPRLSDQLANNLSPEREVAFGDAVVEQVALTLGNVGSSEIVCTAPAGEAALETLRQQLIAGQDLRYDLRLRVFDHEMVNAFAAPGGQVIILRGLLDEAGSPAELAGVLAHEMGHVQARDPTRLAFRSAGSAGILSLLLGDASGGFVIALLGDHLLSAAYTRDAEAAADAFAHRLLTETGIGTAGLASFFNRIDKIDGNLPDYLSTHPSSGNRAEQARAADQGAANPVLTDAEWQSLQRICG